MNVRLATSLKLQNLHIQWDLPQLVTSQRGDVLRADRKRRQNMRQAKAKTIRRKESDGSSY